MDIEFIKELWKPEASNKESGLRWWNGKAEHFSALELPTAETSIGMRIIQRENMAFKGSKILDVGCGGGRFSFALEAMGADVTATDFSPEMIRMATEAGQSRSSKVQFSVDDWHTINLKVKNWDKKFDLVLANMTPAVVSADTFLKLIEASRNWVLLVKPTRRVNSVLDELNGLVKAERDTKSLDDTLAYAFDLAWLTGGQPKLEYEDEVWEMDLPLEKAVEEYTYRIDSMYELSENDKSVIREYLKSIVDQNGNVHETTNTTIAAMYWQIK